MKSDEIVEYIRSEAKYTLRVERFESSHNVNFNSFEVSADGLSVDIYKDGVLAEGCRLRFRGRLPDIILRYTSPTSVIRVN